MPKDLKRDQKRRRPKQSRGGAGSNLAQASVRSRTIQKSKSATQQLLPGETEEERQDLFQMLFTDSDARKLERALITLASISLDVTIANLEAFFKDEVIERLLKLAGTLEGRSSQLALDALRNLLNQAYLLEKDNFVTRIYAKGYLQVVASAIQKATGLLLMEEITAKASQELYRDVIEQAYENLEDLVHFLEADGTQLKELTQSELVLKSYQLISDAKLIQALKSSRIMTAVSKFFRELSEENSLIGNFLTPETAAYIHQWKDAISAENCEFVMNMSLFYFNMLEAKHGHAFLLNVDQATLNFFDSVLKTVFNFTNCRAAQSVFLEKFGKNYKRVEEYVDKVVAETADDKAAEDEEMANGEGANDQVDPIKDTESDKVAASQEFKTWLQVAQGTVVAIQLVEKFAAVGDIAVDENDDDEFEDEESEEMDANNEEEVSAEQAPVIDLDKLQNFAWRFLQQTVVCSATSMNYIDVILGHTVAIPNLMKLPTAVYEVLDQLLAHSFTCVATLLQSYPDRICELAVKVGSQGGNVPQIPLWKLVCFRVHAYLEQNINNPETKVTEDAAECLSILLDGSKQETAAGIKQQILQSDHSEINQSPCLHLPLCRPLSLVLLNSLQSTSKASATQSAVSSPFTLLRQSLLTTLTLVYSTSPERKDRLLLDMAQPDQRAIISDYANILIESCKSGDLLEIATGLDGFYEVFSEDCYDAILQEKGVVQNMQAGSGQLNSMYKNAKKEESYDRQHLAQIENALENVMPFVEYKLAEFEKLKSK